MSGLDESVISVMVRSRAGRGKRATHEDERLRGVLFGVDDKVVAPMDVCQFEKVGGEED